MIINAILKPAYIVFHFYFNNPTTLENNLTNLCLYSGLFYTSQPNTQQKRVKMFCSGLVCLGYLDSRLLCSLLLMWCQPKHWNASPQHYRKQTIYKGKTFTHKHCWFWFGFIINLILRNFHRPFRLISWRSRCDVKLRWQDITSLPRMHPDKNLLHDRQFLESQDDIRWNQLEGYSLEKITSENISLYPHKDHRLIRCKHYYGCYSQSWLLLKE